jgi:DNA (cytosine-5)-methyltransferase 1
MTAQRDGKERLDQLPRQAFMTGWPTPTTSNARSPSVDAATNMYRQNGSKTQQRRRTSRGLPALRLTVLGDADWLFCRDGKWRPVEPGTFPLVDGAAARMGRVEPGVARVASSNRVGRLKGYGNAINAQAAAAFIRAYMGVA